MDQHWRETEIYNATRGDRSGQMRIAFRRFVSRKLRYKLSIRSVPSFPSLRSYLKSACHEYCPFHYCHKKKFFSKPDLHLFRSDPSISILPLFSRSITTVKCANYRSPFLQFLYQFVSIDPHLSILLDRILIRERRMIHGVASLPGSRIHREQKKKKKRLEHPSSRPSSNPFSSIILKTDSATTRSDQRTPIPSPPLRFSH